MSNCQKLIFISVVLLSFLFFFPSIASAESFNFYYDLTNPNTTNLDETEITLHFSGLNADTSYVVWYKQPSTSESRVDNSIFSTDSQGKATKTVTLYPEANDVWLRNNGYNYILKNYNTGETVGNVSMFWGTHIRNFDSFSGGGVNDNFFSGYCTSVGSYPLQESNNNLVFTGIDCTYALKINLSRTFHANEEVITNVGGTVSRVNSLNRGIRVINPETGNEVVYSSHWTGKIPYRIWIDQQTDELVVLKDETENRYSYSYNTFKIEFLMGYEQYSQVDNSDELRVSGFSVVPKKSSHLFKNATTLGNQPYQYKWEDFICETCIGTVDLEFNDGSEWVEQFSDVSAYSDSLKVRNIDQASLRHLYFDIEPYKIPPYELDVRFNAEPPCSLEGLNYTLNNWDFSTTYSTGQHWNSDSHANFSVGTIEISSDGDNQCFLYTESIADSSSVTDIYSATNLYYYTKFFEGRSIIEFRFDDYGTTAFYSLDRRLKVEKYQESDPYYGGIFFTPVNQSGLMFFVEPDPDQEGFTAGYLEPDGTKLLTETHDTTCFWGSNTITVEIDPARDVIDVCGTEINMQPIFKDITVEQGYRIGIGVSGTNLYTSDYQRFYLETSGIKGNYNKVNSVNLNLETYNSSAGLIDTSILWDENNPQTLKSKNTGEDGKTSWSMDLKYTPIYQSGIYSYAIEYGDYTHVCHPDYYDCYYNLSQSDIEQKAEINKSVILRPNELIYKIRAVEDDGSPISYAYVTMHNPDLGITYRGWTDGEGLVSFDSIDKTEGNWYVNISKEGYIDKYNLKVEDDLAHIIEDEWGSKYVYNEYQLDHYPKLKLSVLNINNNPIKDVKVRKANSSEVYVTNEDGKLESLYFNKEGSHKLLLEKGGWENKNITVSVYFNQELFKEVQLKWKGNIEIVRPDPSKVINELPIDIEGRYEIPRSSGTITLYLNGNEIESFDILSPSADSFETSIVDQIRQGDNFIRLTYNTSDTFLTFYEEEPFTFTSSVSLTSDLVKARPPTDLFAGKYLHANLKTSTHTRENERKVTLEGFAWLGVSGTLKINKRALDDDKFKTIKSKRVDKGYASIKDDIILAIPDDMVMWKISFWKSGEKIDETDLSYIHYNYSEGYKNKFNITSCYFDFSKPAFVGSNSEDASEINSCFFNYEPIDQTLNEPPVQFWWVWSIQTEAQYYFILYIDGEPRKVIPSQTKGKTSTKTTLKKLEAGKHSWHVKAISPFGHVGKTEETTFRLSQGYEQDKYVGKPPEMIEKYIKKSSNLYESTKDIIPMPFRMMISTIIVLGVGSAVAKKSSWQIGLIAMMVLLAMLSVLAWMPIWIGLVLVLLSGFVVVRAVLSMFVT